jgi:hypothetical protein
VARRTSRCRRRKRSVGGATVGTERESVDIRLGRHTNDKSSPPTGFFLLSRDRFR